MDNAARAAVAALLPMAACAGCQIFAGLDDPLVDSRVTEASSPSRDGGSTPSDDYAAAVLADRPLLYVRFSEASGARATSSVPNGGHVTLGGDVVRGRPALIRGSDPSVEFSVSGQLVLDEKYDFPLDRSFTYELWVRPNRLGEIISNRVNTPLLRGTGLSLSPEFPFIRFERWGGEQGGDQLRIAFSESRDPITFGSTLHLVAVSNGNDPPVLYVNGARFPGYVKAGGPLPPPTPLIVGGEVKGDYDELAIYDVALSADRVLIHYDLGKR